MHVAKPSRLLVILLCLAAASRGTQDAVKNKRWSRRGASAGGAQRVLGVVNTVASVNPDPHHVICRLSRMKYL